MEYWKEIVIGIIAIIGGIIVILRFFSGFLTKASHENMCNDKMKLIEAKIELAVTRAMNQWLEKNGHRLGK